MKKNIAKQLVMAAVLTSWLASPVLYAGAQDYVGGVPLTTQPAIQLL